MVLVFHAFKREVRPFRHRLDSCSRLERDGLSGFSGHLGDTQLLLITTGIGASRAREAARRALHLFPDAGLVVSCGVAGALRQGLQPGDLIVADRLLLGGRESYHAEQGFSIAPEHLERAEQALRGAGLRFTTGALLTAHRVVPDSAAKRTARQQSGAIAVDMESAAVGIETAAHGLPLVCVRAILDTVADELPSGLVTDEQGRVRAIAAVSFLLRNPGAVRTLPRMVSNLARATKSLADALEVLLAAPAGALD